MTASYLSSSNRLEKPSEVLPPDSWLSPLSPAETKILDLLISGLRPKQIAKGLFKAPNTIYTHIANIKAKLGGGNDYQIGAKAMLMRLADLNRLTGVVQ